MPCKSTGATVCHCAKNACHEKQLCSDAHLLFREILMRYSWFQVRYMSALFLHGMNYELANMYKGLLDQTLQDAVKEVQAAHGTCAASEWIASWQARKRQFEDVVEKGQDAGHYLASSRHWMHHLIRHSIKFNPRRVSMEDQTLLLNEWVQQEEITIGLLALFRAGDSAEAIIYAHNRHMIHWSDLFSRLVVTQQDK